MSRAFLQTVRRCGSSHYMLQASVTAPERAANTVPCSRCTKLCSVGKHTNVIMKPTNSPTQGQLNPRKIRLKVVFGPFFSTANTLFRGLALVLYRKQTRNLTQLNPRKIRLKVVFGPFFSTANTFFVGWDWFYIGKRIQEN